jgi:hypothetical protein
MVRVMVSALPAEENTLNCWALNPANPPVPAILPGVMETQTSPLELVTEAVCDPLSAQETEMSRAFPAVGLTWVAFTQFVRAVLGFGM